MAIKKIPEKYSITCDGCKKYSLEMVKRDIPSEWGQFHMSKVGRDLHGHAVGGHTYKILLCPNCAEFIFDHIKKLSE